jgi:hypothetical protein
VAGYTPQVFSNVSPVQYEKLMAKANAAGIPMSGNSGRTAKMGVEVEWNYSQEKQQLVLTCLHAAFFLGADGVNAKLQASVTEALMA